MAGESLIIGNGNWGVKSGNLLGYNLNGGKYVPRELTFTRATTGTRTNGALLVESTPLSTPRIDYSTGTAALLMEPQRTNISTGSENMASSWLPIGGSLTANSTISPSGLLNATKLTITTANGYAYRDIVTVASTVYTFSVYIKSATGSDVNGALNAAAGSVNFVANNNWQRFSLTLTATAALTTFYIGGFSSLSLGEDIFIWGAQVEAGTYATSYIPTTSASVTRNADELVRSGFQAAGLLTPTQNTFVFDISSTATTGSNFNFITFTATSGLPIAIWKFATNQNFNIQISGTFIDTGVKSGKFAVVQSGSQTKLFINGVLNTTGAATGTIDAIQSYIATYALASPCLVKSLIMYPTALSDAECINITK